MPLAGQGHRRGVHERSLWLRPAPNVNQRPEAIAPQVTAQKVLVLRAIGAV